MKLLNLKLLIVYLCLNFTMVFCKNIQKKAPKYIDFLYFDPNGHRCECGIANEKFYNQNNPQLYKRNNPPRIIGGTEVEPHAFPWLVMVQYNNVSLCGGSIISDLYILTAAHCYRRGYTSERLKVVVGQHNQCVPNNTTVALSINLILRHEDFNEENYFADIMLLRLSMRLSFNEYIQPVCLPFHAPNGGVIPNYIGRRGLVVGWGVTNATSNVLTCTPQKISIPILTKEDCSASSPTLFCAGFPEGGRDSCAGDSGGPFQLINYRGRYELIGIISSGVGCALPNYPGRYTDVIRYVPWIWQNIYDSKFCA